MNIQIFDFEVFKWDWVVVFKTLDTPEYFIYHNDPGAVQAHLEMHQPMLGGFNIKGYDRHILKAVQNDFSPEEVKQVNDWIISGNNGWDYEPLRQLRGYNNLFDLMDDCQQGLSLKAIEAHLGMDIEESEVDFNIDRELTPEELELTIRYCKFDVDATEKLYHLRENYLKSKIQVGAMVGIEPEKAMYMTNARLTAEFLGARPTTYTDERKYVYPENLKREYVPQEVFDHFNRMYDSSIPDEELFKTKTQITIGDTEVTVGYGGVHAGIPNYQYRRDDHD